MRFELFVGLRYLFRQKDSYFSVTTLISTLGVAVGVMALIVVIAVMSGFDRDLKEKITGSHPHLFIEFPGGIRDPEAVMERLAQVGEVSGSAPFLHGQAMLSANDLVHGVLLRGVDPDLEQTVTRTHQSILEGSFHLGGREVLIGKELARKLDLRLGETLEVISPVRKRGEPFRVGGIFHSGMYDYDLNLVFVRLEDAQALFGLEGAVGGIGVQLRNMHRAEEAKKKAEAFLGPGFRVTTWIEMNRNLFGALALEKIAMFVILTLIICVACFNIAGSLIVMVTEKTRDIGILKALGSSNRSIRMIFSLQGFLIGVAGTLLGTGAGLGLCLFLKRYPFIRLPQDIYYIETLPVDIQWLDSLAIVLAAVLISGLATLYPAWRASRLDPVEALRYE